MEGEGTLDYLYIVQSFSRRSDIVNRIDNNVEGEGTLDYLYII